MVEVKEKSIRFMHEMFNDETGEVAARTVLAGVYFDTKLRRARPLPDDIRERLQQMILSNSAIAT
jgi:acyl-CoA thioester hydrolase